MPCAKNKLFIKEYKWDITFADSKEMLEALRGEKGKQRKLAIYRKINKEIDRRLEIFEKIADEAANKYQDEEEFWADFENEAEEIMGY